MESGKWKVESGQWIVESELKDRTIINYQLSIINYQLSIINNQLRKMYCTVQDIVDDLTENVVAQLSNDEEPNVVNSEIVSKYISDVTQIIDGFLRGRYTLPLISEHSILKKICIDIVKYELYKRRGKVFDSIKNFYKDGIASLQKIQKGMITLNEGTAETRPGFFLVSNRNPVIEKTKLDNFI